MYGQALLDIPAYKILMGCDGMNLIETKQLFNLTDAEEQLLVQKKRGNALVMIGSKRLHVNFQIPDYKFKFMGNSGGRQAIDMKKKLVIELMIYIVIVVIGIIMLFMYEFSD